MKKKIAAILAIILLLIMPALPAEASVNRPVVLIDAVETEPHPVTSGSEFTLKITLNNHGNQSARRINLTLDSIEGQETLEGFSPLKKTNTIHFGRIDANKEASEEITMITAGDLEPGLYNLVYNLEYWNHQGIHYESRHVSGIIVSGESAMSLHNVMLPLEVVGPQNVTLEGEVVNGGRYPLENVLLTISGDIDFYPSAYFLGTFNPGDMDFFSANGQALKSGKNRVTIEVSYLDSMNQKQSSVLEKEITVTQIEENSEPEKGEDSGNGFFSSFGSFFRRIFGLG
ncbi:COG1361 family protein [Candidatus Contubernalis alkaliaceticus]|uniref:hypothetical protein n=1 Tax=Candidatus Contubernalis alkaliaceticus TaxID=338645 RepID=UPI001F4C1BF0|nr:hypothetical protein [Candidatus Contubernalis alkalaceticus]UNC91967.1 hypothetical protein HUE98_07575 [Candidatus Contubernalis alkalaceticus]